MDTVAEIREWLETEPNVSDVEQLLEDERNSDNTRVTAIRTLKEYIENNEETYTFRVRGDTPEFNQGEIVEVNPEDYPNYIQDGRLRRWFE